MNEQELMAEGARRWGTLKNADAGELREECAELYRKYGRSDGRFQSKLRELAGLLGRPSASIIGDIVRDAEAMENSSGSEGLCSVCEEKKSTTVYRGQDMCAGCAKETKAMKENRNEDVPGEYQDEQGMWVARCQICRGLERAGIMEKIGGKWQCEECAEETKARNSLPEYRNANDLAVEGARRYGTLGNAGEPKGCPFCGSHEYEMYGSTQNKCAKCGKVSDTKMWNEGSKPEGHIEKCPDCGDEFSTDAAVEGHMKKEHGVKNAGVRTCSKCGHSIDIHGLMGCEKCGCEGVVA